MVGKISEPAGDDRQIMATVQVDHVTLIGPLPEDIPAQFKLQAEPPFQVNFLQNCAATVRVNSPVLHIGQSHPFPTGQDSRNALDIRAHRSSRRVRLKLPSGVSGPLM